MGIKDVSYIAFLDSNKKVLYSYNYDLLDVESFLQTLDENNGSIYLYKDQLVIHHRCNDISIVFLAQPDSNELFVGNAFDALVQALGDVMKNWCVERIAEKYDQLILFMNEFVFHGIILVDETEELKTRVMKRTFENFGTLKVNKGFASLLSRATKSLRK